MPVRLDELPPERKYPVESYTGPWMFLVPLLVLGWVVITALEGDREPADLAFLLMLPVLVGFFMVLCQALYYQFQRDFARSWNHAREQHRQALFHVGRRSLDVLGASLYTGLRQPGDGHGAVQLEALRSGAKAVRLQTPRSGAADVRHSQLLTVADTPHGALLELLKRVLADLAPGLQQVPESTQLVLLLDIDSSLSPDQIQRIWSQAWQGCGIRQRIAGVTEGGLAALDQWLDERMSDQYLGVVVAVRVAPGDVPESAEAAVGLLLVDRQKAAALQSLAQVHRPEREQGATPEHLQQATERALQWASLSGASILRLWRAGVHTRREVSLMTAIHLESLPPQPRYETCNLDAALGQTRGVSPWVAVAAAAMDIERNGGAQCVISGNGIHGGRLWSTVLSAAKTTA